jgi:hypothetical protein
VISVLPRVRYDSDVKRRLAKPVGLILLLLVAGAIVNVAVAWGCTLWSPLEDSAEIEYPDDVPADVAKEVPSEWLTQRPHVSFIMMSFTDQCGFGCQVTRFGVMEAIAGVTQYGPDKVLHIERAGWPLLSLQCDGQLDWRNVGRRGQSADPPKWQGGFAVPQSWKPREIAGLLFGRYQRPLAFQPVWPGFAGNTLFYAAILWLMFAAPFVLRRRSRIKHGLCRRCGYDLRGHPANSEANLCPECGASA